jgi:membrane protein
MRPSCGGATIGASVNLRARRPLADHREPVLRLLGWGHDVLRRLLELEFVDRSLVVGAQAFGALIPLLIVLASLGARNGNSFADAVVARFHLEGAGAQAVHETFAAPADNGTITVLGAVVVVYSTLAFTRALQRTFELTWNLPRRGVRGTGWGLLWIGVFALWWALFPSLDDGLPRALRMAAALTGAFGLWLVTPYLLLSRRLRWRLLIPQAALTAGGMTILSAGSVLYVPRAIETSAAEFGAIGVAFTMLSVLWAGGFVLVTAAAIGAFLTMTTWSRASPGSVTPPFSSTSPAPGS